MPDIIQEAYNVVNAHLGEQQRNMKRVPEKYEPLIKSIEGLVAYAYQLGKVEGQNEVNRKIYNFFKEFDREPRYPIYKAKYKENENESQGTIAGNETERTTS